MITNIFLNSYQQPENKLTYNFFSLLEILNSKIVIDFLTGKQTKENPIFNIKTVYGGHKRNPDGSFDIKLINGSNITVYYENKTNRRSLDIEQLKGHLELCDKNDLLLVTSPRKSDSDIIKKINDTRIIFKTWQEISFFLKKNFYDNLIVLQFVEYGKKSGEFEELGEIYNDEIKIYCNYLKINFDSKIDSIFRNFIHEFDLNKFNINNITLDYKNNWGRKGAEIKLIKNGKYGQFGAISMYYNTDNHRIAFKNNVPEIAFFWDVDPEYKKLLQSDNDFREVINILVSDGFESNLDNELTSNSWRLLVFRQSILDFEVINVQEIISFAEKVIIKILRNNANNHQYFGEFFNE